MYKMYNILKFTKTVLVTEMIKNLPKEKICEEEKENVQESDISNRNKEKAEIHKNLEKFQKVHTPNSKNDKQNLSKAYLKSDPGKVEKFQKVNTPSSKNDKLNVSKALHSDPGNKEKLINKKIPSEILKPTHWEILVNIKKLNF
jgi:hypothetical protein